VANETVWMRPITVWRGQIKQAEDFAPASMHILDAANSRGKRVGYIGPMSTVRFTGVYSGSAGTNNLVVYYTNGDCGGAPRYFNVKVNGGPAQNRALPGTCGSWSKVAHEMVTLSGFVAGTANTVEFMGDGQHAAPDLDWIEVIQAGTGPGAGVACVAGRTVSLRALVNGKYASARSENSGYLAAQASTASTAEQFDVVDAGGGYVALRSKMNNLYVSVATVTGSLLQARSTAIGSTEKFKFEARADGFYGLKSYSNGKLVAANVAATNAPLQATSATSSNFEAFQCQ
jgi:hypothetical protein